jgi:hypothetical protein
MHGQRTFVLNDGVLSDCYGGLILTGSPASINRDLRQIEFVAIDRRLTIFGPLLLFPVPNLAKGASGSASGLEDKVIPFIFCA